MSLKKVHAFERDWVVFRTQSGMISACQNICPHIGADLSNGHVESEFLVCPLHHWKFGTNGQLNMDGHKCQLKQVLTCEEYLGIIFVKLGENLPALPKLDYQKVSSKVFVYNYPAPYQMVGINGFDTQHLLPIHGRKLIEEPKVSVKSAQTLSIRYKAKVIGKGIRDRLFRLFGLLEVDVDIDCSGGNFLIFHHHKVKASTYFTLMPIDEKSARIFVVTNREKPKGFMSSIKHRILVEIQQLLIVNFIKEDFEALWNSEFRPENLLHSQDESMKIWVEHYQKLTRTSIL